MLFDSTVFGKNMHKLYIIAALLTSFNFSVLTMQSTKQEVLNLKLAVAVFETEIDWKKIKNTIEAGADVEYKLWGGNTLLHTFARKSDIYCMQKIIKFGANVDSRNGNDETPLHYASRNGNLESIKCLINNNADINAIDKNGNTLLHLIAVQGEQEIVKYLLSFPVMMQNFNECQDCQKFNKRLLKYVKNPTSFACLSQKEQVEFIQKVKKKHLSLIKQMILSRNNNKYTVLDLAFKYALKTQNSIGKESLNLFKYLHAIDKAQDYEDLDQGLKDQFKKKYTKNIPIFSYWDN